MFRRSPRLAILMAIASFAVSGEVLADCAQTGMTVTCDSTPADDTDGFDAGVDDDLDLTVDAGATVDGGANTEAIRLNDDSSVTNNGDITLGTADGAVVSLGEGATVTNDGNITATGADSRAIAVGDNATIINNATGVITGGTDGASDTGFAVEFTGTDDTAINSLTNDAGTINGGADGAVEGGAGLDRLFLEDGSTTIGDINLHGGVDFIRLLGNTATATGNVDLGEGSDVIHILDGGTWTGNVDLGQGADTSGNANDTTVGDGGTLDGDLIGGAGSDNVTLEVGAMITGQIDLGEGTDSLEADDGVTLGGTVHLGDDGDDVEILDGATVTVTLIELGAGSDTVDVFGDTDVADMSGASLTGGIDLGQGVDADGDVNTLTIGINSTVGGDVLGGAGADTVNLRENASVGGQLDLRDGNDRVSFGKGADIDGAIDLGDGDDRFTLELESHLDLMGGTLMAGDGNDTIVFTGPTDLADDTQARLTGSVDLGDAGPDPEADANVLLLNQKTLLTGSVAGGDQADQVFVGTEASISGTVTLNDGEDILVIGIDATVGGAVDLGPGDDIFLAGDDAEWTAKVDLGDGEDTAIIFSTAVMGAELDLGPGDDILQLRPSGAIPAILTLDAGTDSLQLDAEDPNNPGSGFDNEIDLFTVQTDHAADPFERLIVGPDDDGNPADVWRISTSGVAVFDESVIFRNGDVELDGTVQFDIDDVTPTNTATQEAGSTLVFELGNDIDNSQLDITGGLTIEAAATARVVVDGRIDEATYDLIVTTLGIDRLYEDSEIEIPGDGVTYSFAHQLNATDDRLQLVVTRNSFDEFGRNASEQNVAEALEAGHAAGGATAFFDFVNGLDALSESDLRDAFAQLGAESYDAHTSSMVSWGRAQQRVLHSRPLNCERFTYSPRPEIVSANPCGERGFMPWAQVVGDFSRHAGGDDRGFDSFGGGVLMGVDNRVSDRVWWSADIGFGHVEIESDNDAEGEFNTVDLGVAAGAVFGALQARGSLTYSHGFHELDRRIDFVGDTVRGKFDSDRVTVAAEAGYRTRLGPIVFEPGVRADFTHIEEEALDETGLDVAALDIDARKSDLFSVAGGLSISTAILKYRYVGEWLEWADGVWTPMVSAHWRQGFGDVDRDIAAEFAEAPAGTGDFDSEARDSNGGVELRGGITFQPMKQGASVGIHYNGYFGDDVMSHSADASVRIPF